MLDHKEGWVPKNWCFRTLVLEKTFESPLDRKEVGPVNPKGNRSWIFIGRTDHKAEAPILWPPDAKSRLIGKDSDAGKDSGQVRGDDRGWGGWMASLTQWTWIWANSRRWWRTGKSGGLQSMGSQSRTRLSNWTARRDTRELGACWPSLCVSISLFLPRDHTRRMSVSATEKERLRRTWSCCHTDLELPA